MLRGFSFCFFSTPRPTESTPLYLSGGAGVYKGQGYAVKHGIQVNTKGLDRVGEVVDLMIEGGITQINSVQFGTQSMPELQQQVLKDAVAHARMQAQALADAAGVTLGEAVRMRVASPAQPAYRDTFAATAESSAVPIMPGEGKIQVSVTVDYAIQ